MIFEEGWQQEKYEEVFETTIRQVRRQQAMDPDFTMNDLNARLDDLYVRQGQGWEGKSVVLEIVEAATIAAYEYILADWEE